MNKCNEIQKLLHSVHTDSMIKHIQVLPLKVYDTSPCQAQFGNILMGENIALYVITVVKL